MDEFDFEEAQEDVYQAIYLACRRHPLADSGGQSRKKRQAGIRPGLFCCYHGTIHAIPKSRAS
jgi:hypothetical protein